MSPRRSAALAGHELRAMRGEMGLLLQLVLMPLIMMAFLQPLFRATTVGDAGGAAQGVPGMAVLFAMFLVGHVGYLFFREHRFGTWERLRAAPLTPLDVIVAKALPATGLALVQQLGLLALSAALFGLRVQGSVIAVVAVGYALSVCLVAFGVMAAAFIRNAQRLNALSGLMAFVIGGLGGALAPVETLPAWAQTLARFTPGYWAIEGYQAAIVDGARLSGVVRHVGALAAFAAIAAAFAALRFRFDETKVVTE